MGFLFPLVIALPTNSAAGGKKPHNALFIAEIAGVVAAFYECCQFMGKSNFYLTLLYMQRTLTDEDHLVRGAYVNQPFVTSGSGIET